MKHHCTPLFFQGRYLLESWGEGLKEKNTLNCENKGSQWHIQIYRKPQLTYKSLYYGDSDFSLFNLAFLACVTSFTITFLF